MGRTPDHDAGPQTRHLDHQVSRDEAGIDAIHIEPERKAADIESAALQLRRRVAIRQRQRFDLLANLCGQDKPGRRPNQDNEQDDGAKNDDSLFHGAFLSLPAMLSHSSVAPIIQTA
ncbi:hypothetical protein D3C87_1832650 [compost metagenome]